MPPRRPLVPPTGFYDPALDEQRRASGRGLVDMRQDMELAGARAGQDFTFGLEDLTRQRDRGFQDFTSMLDRGRGDYDRDVQMLDRSYQQLARRQAEGARSAGVLSGGLALKSAAIRAQNQAIDRQPLDTAWDRMQFDVHRGRERLGQDFDQASGRLAVDYGRGVTDRATALGRGEREDLQFGLGIDAQRMFQATQAGWTPPPGGRGPTYSPAQQRTVDALNNAWAGLSRRRRGMIGGFRPANFGGG